MKPNSSERNCLICYKTSRYSTHFRFSEFKCVFFTSTNGNSRKEKVRYTTVCGFVNTIDNQVPKPIHLNKVIHLKTKPAHTHTHR